MQGGAPGGRYGQPGQGFGGQFPGMRPPRAQFAPRPGQPLAGPRGPIGGAPRPNTRYSNQARNIGQPLLAGPPAVRE